MKSIHDIKNAEELARSIEQLSGEIDRMRNAGPLSVSDVQKAGSLLTLAKLVLNDLVRIDTRTGGASRERAERFAMLDSRIRAIRDDLYQCLTNRGHTAAAKGAATDGSEDHDPAR